MVEQHILHVDSVQKTIGIKQILSDVFLQCKTGEIIGLFGRNGSGKSTLFKIIFGIIVADHKFVAVNGTKLFKDAELRQYSAYLPQNTFIPTHLTVKKAITLSANADTANELYQDQLIASLLRHKITDLSTGERRYVECMLILSKEAPFLLLDEPFSSLSPIMIEQVKSKIQSVSQCKGIIVSDHSYEHITEIATTMVLLHDGRLHHLSSAADLQRFGYLSNNR